MHQILPLHPNTCYRHLPHFLLDRKRGWILRGEKRRQLQKETCGGVSVELEMGKMIWHLTNLGATRFYKIEK